MRKKLQRDVTQYVSVTPESNFNFSFIFFLDWRNLIRLAHILFQSSLVLTTWHLSPGKLKWKNKYSWKLISFCLKISLTLLTFHFLLNFVEKINWHKNKNAKKSNGPRRLKLESYSDISNIILASSSVLYSEYLLTYLNCIDYVNSKFLITTSILPHELLFVTIKKQQRVVCVNHLNLNNYN